MARGPTPCRARSSCSECFATSSRVVMPAVSSARVAGRPIARGRSLSAGTSLRSIDARVAASRLGARLAHDRLTRSLSSLPSTADSGIRTPIGLPIRTSRSAAGQATSTSSASGPGRWSWTTPSSVTSTNPRPRTAKATMPTCVVSTTSGSPSAALRTWSTVVMAPACPEVRWTGRRAPRRWARSAHAVGVEGPVPGLARGVLDEAEPFGVGTHPLQRLAVESEVHRHPPAVAAGAGYRGQTALGVQAELADELHLALVGAVGVVYPDGHTVGGSSGEQLLELRRRGRPQPVAGVPDLLERGRRDLAVAVGREVRRHAVRIEDGGCGRGCRCQGSGGRRKGGCGWRELTHRPRERTVEALRRPGRAHRGRRQCRQLPLDPGDAL